MLSFSNYDVITFDCYGTLIDWESGILGALKPILAAHGKALSDAELLELYGDFEADAEAGEYQTYREVLESVVGSLGRRLDFTPTPEQSRSLADSVSGWRPWPDTVAALQQLQARYRLVVISNVDDDLFAATRPQLHVEFADIITAQQARCYKPGLKIFQLALNRIGSPPDRILHVGQSIFHDVLPAQSLGMGTVWVNRTSRRADVGAVKRAEGKPDLTVPDVAALAALTGVRLGVEAT
jgi:2-haloacid dehalogenase